MPWTRRKEGEKRPVPNLQRDNSNGLWTLALHLHRALPIFNVSRSSLTLIHYSCCRPELPAGGGTPPTSFKSSSWRLLPTFTRIGFYLLSSVFCQVFNSALCCVVFCLFVVFLLFVCCFFTSWSQQKKTKTVSVVGMKVQTRPIQTGVVIILSSSAAWNDHWLPVVLSEFFCPHQFKPFRTRQQEPGRHLRPDMIFNFHL